MIRGLVLANLLNAQDMSNVDLYKANVVRITISFKDFLYNESKRSQLLETLSVLKNKQIGYILLTGHGIAEKALGEGALAADFLISLDREIKDRKLYMPRLIIFGNENNELQYYWHDMVTTLHHSFPEYHLSPQAATSIAERAGYSNAKSYFNDKTLVFLENAAIHFYLAPTWKIEHILTNMRRVNRLVNVLKLIKSRGIDHVYITESHDGEPESANGDYTRASYFGDKILTLLTKVLGIEVRVHYNSANLSKEGNTILHPTKRDVGSAALYAVGAVIFLPYTLFTLLNILRYKILYE